MTAPSWEGAKGDRLRQLWQGDLSAQQIARVIAAEFGCPCTKNAVLSRVHRWGLPPRRRSLSGRPRTFVAPPVAIPAPEIEPMIMSETKPVRTGDLEPRHCLWPLNDGAPHWLHCGAERLPDRPYCAKHRAMSVSPTGPRKALAV